MLQSRNSYTVAVVGATGAVGNEMVEILEDRDFPVATLRLFASEQSRGKRIVFRGQPVKVEQLREDVFQGIDLAFFCAGTDRSKEFAPAAVRAGCVVIDASSQWRMDPGVPLVVPEVNAQDLLHHQGIIASPDCATIPLTLVLKPIHEKATIRRVVVTVFQAVSRSGRGALEELLNQSVDLLNMRELRQAIFPHQIAFNILPRVGAFQESGETGDERNMTSEARKVLGEASFRLTATAVHVPVFRCDSASVNIEMEKPMAPNEVRALLAQTPGVVVFDAPEKDVYPMPVEVAGKDEVYAGRIRKDESVENGLNLWIVADNLRKGSALNAVQIAEHLVSMARQVH